MLLTSDDETSPTPPEGWLTPLKTFVIPGPTRVLVHISVRTWLSLSANRVRISERLRLPVRTTFSLRTICGGVNVDEKHHLVCIAYGPESFLHDVRKAVTRHQVDIVD